MDIKINSIVTGKQVPFACCKVKNDTACVRSPNITTSFIEKGCYQVMRNWVTSNAGVLVGVGASILIIELILVVLAFVICCTLRKKTFEKDQNMGPIKHFKLPHAHLVPRNQNLFYPGDSVTNSAYEGPILHDNSGNMYPLRNFRKLLYDRPIDAYDKLSHYQDLYSGSLDQNESYNNTLNKESRNEYPERPPSLRSSGYFGAPPSEHC